MIFDREKEYIKNEDDDLKNVKEFKDEPHFQYDIIHNNIPLYLDQLYYPLVMEFPSSPGIDIVYGNINCLLLAELKHKKYNIDKAQREAINHYEKYKKYCIKEIFNYGRDNIKEANINNINRLESDNENKLNMTLEELHNSGKVKIACIVYGPINDENKKRICDVIGLHYNDKEIKYYVYNKNIVEVNYNKESENYKRNIKSTTKRNTKDNKVNFYSKIRTHQEMKDIYDHVSKNDFIIRIGSGKEISYSIKIRDEKNKMRSLMNVYPKLLEIPGNIYNQQYVLNIDEKQIDQYFKNIENECKKNVMYYTDAGTLRIHIDNLKNINLDNIFCILSDFRNEIKKMEV